ncbi:hypothetical protein [[Mycobacterium] burgundiense]|uniref:HTH luxR-type domain-containing protein n=1 Tax=[Mycobacterium] burgundiense TaxID=3064286 RepID=A0ABM9LVX0_9MYCO|nr:hypothetical protein [Mycolicibacterium sp. MU0053]CAJ1505636.1 hypothetical protein MU0053_002985 [Mycolicibacterium sp. MU0053]
MTRFTPSDLDLARAADELLIDAGKRLAGVVGVAASGLASPYPDSHPTEILAALQRWLGRQARIRECENEILALLLMRGASRRGLADAIGVRPETISTRVGGHRAATATRADIARDTAGRWQWADPG